MPNCDEQVENECYLRPLVQQQVRLSNRGQQRWRLIHVGIRLPV